ncbi:hypothetical protein BDZ97DRAFT_1906818 [Flammula alnicola]|nr:hypothetical protein BDZ97DRAFT_1906818 [Flammula alnicola]
METHSVSLETSPPTPLNDATSTGEPEKRRNTRQKRGPHAKDSAAGSTASQTRPPRRARPPATSNDASTSTAGAGNDSKRDGSQPRNARRRKLPSASAIVDGAGPPPGSPDSASTSSAPTSKPRTKRIGKDLPQGDDLTSSLIRGLSTPPYPDCPICFSSIRPEQAIWSCSPSIPLVISSETQVQQYCWTSFHVRCIRSWADKSVKEVAEAWRARGEDKKGDWRCPGCQAKREAIPSGYWCFCNSTPEPKPPRLSTPHSCGNSCSRPRESGCGHPCPLQCHPGPCPPCQKNVLTFRCGIDVRGNGVRNLSCGQACGRPLSCGKHTCDKICHDGDCGKCQLTELVTCWCGKEQKVVGCGEGEDVQCFVEGEKPWIGRFGCDRICERPFDCGKHRCQKSCHPPSSTPATCPRSPCGATTKSLSCYEVHSSSAAGLPEKEILCDKQCQALRACGRHQCRRLCCPLASLAMNVGKKGKRRGVVDDSHGIGEEQGGLHEYAFLGNHRCERRDHKGICPPCLQSSFEELVCACGRTVYEPPIPCGTRMQCHYPCARPPPPCNHPPTPHSCHDDTIVPNVRCSLETEKVSCGTVCGKLMTCGFHHCERLCHGDECGPCTAPCGKSRKSCLPNHHPCTLPCHAPSSCPETEPCQSLVTLTCPCGRIRQAVHCGRTVNSRGSGHAQAAPKCSNDCQIAKRNARLADALGISSENRDKSAAAVTYSDELVAFARSNNKFLPVVEKAFADFVASEKRTQVLPHMPPDRRKFVHDLAAVYRMDTQMVDQEPHRSVQLLRRVDTRVPTPLLSAGAQSPSWRPTGSVAPSPRPPTPGSSTQTSGATQRGWTSVVSKPTTGASASASVVAPRPTSTLTGMSAGSLAARSLPQAQVALPSTSDIASNDPVPDNWEDDV